MSSVSSSVTLLEVDCKKYTIIIFDPGKRCIVCVWITQLGFQTHHGTGQVLEMRVTCKTVGHLWKLLIVPTPPRLI